MDAPDITLAIRNFQVIARADIALGGITLIAGRNSAGKSSVAKAAAAALTGRGAFGLAKKDLGALVLAGTKSGSITLAGAEGKAAITYPKGEVTAEGRPPSISPMAAGLEHILDMPLKDRATALARLLRTEPDEGDLAAALADTGLYDGDAGEVARQTWERIHIGWDVAHAECKSTGTKLKDRWERIAGQNYGSAVAARWRPADWSPDLEQATVEDLAARQVEAQEALEAAHAAAAVDAAEVDRLTAEAGKEGAARTALAEADGAEDRAEQDHGAAERHRASLPPARQEVALCCPHCQGRVSVRQGELVAAEAPLPEAELKKRRMAIADADGDVARLHAELNKAKARTLAARRAVDTASDAADRLKEIGGRKKAGPSDAVPNARSRLAMAQRNLEMLKDKLETERLSKLIRRTAALVLLLAPTGVRQARTVMVLDTFNSGPLRNLCEAAGWRDVRVEPDLSITYGGMAYELLAGLGPQPSSDQYRARAVLQVALAQIAGDGLTILDAADVLDRPGRSGLIDLLLSVEGLSALVGMTYTAPEDAPDLGRAGIGRTYWVADGVARPLVEMVAGEAVPA